MPNNRFKLILSKNWLLLIISLFCAVIIFAVANFSSPIRPSHTVINNIEHLVDTQKQYSISSILDISEDLWKSHIQELTSLGLSNELHWFKFTLSNIDPAQSWLLEIDYAHLDRVNLWFVQNNNIIAEYQVGDHQIFSQRTIEHENFLFPIPKNGQPLDVKAQCVYL